MTAEIPSAEFVVELGRGVGIDLVGMGLFAAVVGLVVAFGYRRWTTRPAPAAAVALVALGLSASWLVARLLRTGPAVGELSVAPHVSAAHSLSVILFAGVTAAGGHRLGDAIAREVYDVTSLSATGDAASLVRSARLAVELELPGTIDDAPGYEPVDAAVKRDLAGSLVRLPHDSTGVDRRSRLERHVEREYGLGIVEVEFADDGTIARLSVGHRISGLGSMLPPDSVAVAVRADPPRTAGPGDPIEVWSGGPESRLITTGTMRSATGAVATLVVDAAHATALERDGQYRLLIRDEEPTDAHELLSGLRAADETVLSTTVEEGDALAGEFVGWLPARVLVIERDGDLLALPDDRETLQSGDELWLLGSSQAVEQCVRLQ